MDDDPKFDPGNIVKRRSGPFVKMTVNWHREGTVHCQWLEEMNGRATGTLQEGNFNAGDLVLVSKE